MPDLTRVGYYAKEPVPLSEEERRVLWEAETFGEAETVLRARGLVPALSVQECVEALCALGFSLDRVEVVPIGVEAAWRGEVVAQYPPPGTEMDERSPVRLFVSHPSVADRLPEGFVAHERPGGDVDRGVDDEWSGHAFGKWELERRSEPPAARLLRVIDAAAWQARLESCRVRSIFDGLGDDAPLSSALVEWVGASREHLPEERVRWLSNYLWLLPPSTGVRIGATRLLRILLDAPVRIETREADALPIDPAARWVLGSEGCRFGGECLLGETLDDREIALDLVVGPVPPDEAARLHRSETFRRAIETWANGLLPVLRPWRLRWEVIGTDRDVASVGQDAPASMLGVTTRLRAGAGAPA
jgi:hypothetical protein